MNDPTTDGIKEFVGWIVGGVATAAMTVFTIIARYSKVALNRARDSDEVKTMADKNARIEKLEFENERLARERNDAVSRLGGLTATVSNLTAQVEAMRAEQRQSSETVRHALNKRSAESDHQIEDLSIKVSENTLITEQARDRADAAFQEANTVNKKIEAIGLATKDGTPLSQRDADSRLKGN